MERVFSVEEISDPFWAPPPPPPATASTAASASGGGAGVAQANAMNRCPSEWYFQKFLEQAVLDSPNANANPNPNGNGRRGGGEVVVEIKAAAAPAVGREAADTVVDPVEYNALLKQKLEKDLAAVAMWRASGAMPPESSVADSSSPNSDSSHIGSQTNVRGNGIPVQNKLGGGQSGGLGPHLIQNADLPVKQATSSSSREPSDDDDLEEEAETMDNANPVEEKLMRRKQSNRESARRSRSRKAAHLNELEAQVSQLRVENSSLLRRLADVNQKYNDAAVDNRVLKADVETLRAKVKMAEDTVKRATGMSTLFPAASDMSSLSVPFNGSPSDATSDAAVPIQDDPNNYFAAANDGGVNTYMPEISSSTQVEDLINGALAAGKMGRTASLQRVASLEHLQKRICGGPTSSGSV